MIGKLLSVIVTRIWRQMFRRRDKRKGAKTTRFGLGIAFARR
jgi:hypothetical protein